MSLYSIHRSINACHLYCLLLPASSYNKYWDTPCNPTPRSAGHTYYPPSGALLTTSISRNISIPTVIRVVAFLAALEAKHFIQIPTRRSCRSPGTSCCSSLRSPSTTRKSTTVEISVSTITWWRGPQVTTQVLGWWFIRFWGRKAGLGVATRAIGTHWAKSC